MDIGLKIKEIREAKDLKVKDLAKFLDVSTTQVYNYEDGTNSPSLEKLEKIAEFLQVKLGDLLGIEAGSLPPDIEKLKRERDSLHKDYVDLLKKYTALVEEKGGSKPL